MTKPKTAKTKTSKTKPVKVRTQVFAYKGIVGIQSDFEAEGIINDMSDPNQLGFVIDAKYVDIQPEALNLLKKIKKNKGCIGDINVSKSGKRVIFSFFGGPLAIIDPKLSEGSSDYHPELLKATNGVETPEDFKNHIDNN